MFFSFWFSGKITETYAMNDSAVQWYAHPDGCPSTPGTSPQLDTGSSLLYLPEREDATYPATPAKAAAQVLNGNKNLFFRNEVGAFLFSCLFGES